MYAHNFFENNNKDDFISQIICGNTMNCSGSHGGSTVSSLWQRCLSMNPPQVRCHYFMGRQIHFFGNISQIICGNTMIILSQNVMVICDFLWQ
jgi:hypothetical protein